MFGENGVPEGIRTPDLRFRKPLLYPAELPGRGAAPQSVKASVLRLAHYSRKVMARSRAILFLAALVLSGPALAQNCAGPLAPVGKALSVRERLEIELSDGRRFAQAGLAPFSATRDGPARFEAARAALSHSLQDGVMEAPAALPPEDRWGRITTHLYVRGENLGVWLAGAGRARVAPAGSDPCGRLLLNAEAKARQAKLGLWADPYYFVLAAENSVALSARSGEFVLVEGRILRLGQTSARFYLDFGAARGVDLSVTISKQFAKAFTGAGLRIEALPGQRVRVRGLVENRPGPSIDIVSPLALDVIGR
jgi:micrococcal nuclease